MATYPASRDDRVLPTTRAFIAPFLIVAFVVLYGFPSHTDRLFAWTIRPTMTPVVLASAYLGGFYFFTRALWASLRLGLLAVTLFATLLWVATVLHCDRFNHGHVAFWLWAGLYLAAPFLVTSRHPSSSRSATPPTVATPGPHCPTSAAGYCRSLGDGAPGPRGARHGSHDVPRPCGDDSAVALDAHVADLPGGRCRLLPRRRRYRRIRRRPLGRDPAHGPGGDAHARGLGPRLGRAGPDRPFSWLMLVGFAGLLLGSGYLWYAYEVAPRRRPVAVIP